MRVLFTRTTRFETEGRQKGPLYEAGSIHDLRQDLAEKWIRREVAVEAPPEAVPEAPAIAAAPARPVASAKTAAGAARGLAGTGETD